MERWRAPGDFALTRAIGRFGALSSFSSTWVVPQAQIREACAAAAQDPYSTSVGSIGTMLVLHLRARLTFDVVPEPVVAVAALSAVLEANGSSPIDDHEWAEVHPQVSALLPYLDHNDPRTWAELDAWVEVRAAGGCWTDAGRLLRGVVVGPLTGRDPVRQASLGRECEAVAAFLADRGIQVAQTHLGAHLDRDPRQISAADGRALRSADVCVFVVDGPSTGVGILVGLAHRHNAIVAVLAPSRGQLELSPLLIGMDLPHTLVRGDTPEARLAELAVSLAARLGDGSVRLRLREQSVADWTGARLRVREAVQRRGGPDAIQLPAWFSRMRLQSLMEEEDSLAGASGRELEALARALGLPWEALGPLSVQSAPDSGLRGDELQAAATARRIGRWSAHTYDEVLLLAVQLRTRYAALVRDDQVRAHLNLSDPQAWLDLWERIGDR